MDDKYKAQKKYAKSHIKKLGCSYPAEFVDAFKDACNTLGVKQSEVIREAMNKIIEQANKNQGHYALAFILILEQRS